MKTDYTIENLIKLYYSDSNIPAYLYDGGVCRFCAPNQSDLTLPPRKYLELLSQSEDRITYYTTDYGTSYCSIKLDFLEEGRLIIGPAAAIPYTRSDLQNIYRDYTVANNYREDFNRFLNQIPCLSVTALLRKCIFLNYCLHQEVLLIEDFLTKKNNLDEKDKPNSNSSIFIEEFYESKEEQKHNQTYAVEEGFLKMIRAGDYEALKRFDVNESNFNMGITGPNMLRQLKNTIIITTTICTRAAIEGGLDYDTAYQLSDYFIQSCEQLDNADSLNSLLTLVSETFARKVADAKLPLTSDVHLQKAIRYIQQNTNQHITVVDVAKHVGFSRSYFSAYFKKNMGFSVSAFILRCKLEEGRNLLQYTDKSISTISNYLCFSSQSHFHTAFKKQFAVTPTDYRKQTLVSS